MLNKIIMIMEKLKLYILVLISGLLIVTNTGQVTVTDQEKTEPQWQEMREGGQDNVEMDQLPWAVQETLIRDYAEWTPSEVLLDRDPSEGIFYNIKLNNRTGKETKTVKISTGGKVLEEVDGEQESENEKGKPHPKDYKGKTWFV
jgi:hypothetical protein